jgi:hypothetical protein
MNENIRPVTYFDKTITFLLVEPLYSTFRHYNFPFTQFKKFLPHALLEQLSETSYQAKDRFPGKPQIPTS